MALGKLKKSVKKASKGVKKTVRNTGDTLSTGRRAVVNGVTAFGKMTPGYGDYARRIDEVLKGGKKRK